MKKELLQDWTKIFVDTSALLELYKSRGANPDARATFIGTLFNYLSKNPSLNGERTFYLSAITLSEILTIESNEDKVKKAVKALENKNTEFCAFDEDVASVLSSELWQYLGRDQMNAIARQQGYQEHELLTAREIINKDLMIIATCMYKGCDVVLTGDKNFYSLATDLDVFCAYCDEKYFAVSGKYITSYESRLSEQGIGQKYHVLTPYAKTQGN